MTMSQDEPEAWRARALSLALAGRADATRQQRVLQEHLERGEECHPSRVVDALWTQQHWSSADEAAARRGRSRLEALGGRFLLVDEPAYPDALRLAWPELGAPLWLFTAGRPSCVADTVAVAVVGTRAPTLDGLRTTRSVADALARAGAVVVSGLARGIDQAAHRAALDAGGQTIAVLGTGLGVDYPAGSPSLRSAIVDCGALLTELAPGVGPRPWHFLARNRIISGLAVATVVVEGRSTSGALQTARMAAGQGRDVWAVPGSINAPTSQAPLALLRDGAHPLTSVEVFLEALGLRGDTDPATADTDHAPVVDGLSAEARIILQLLGAVPATTDALMAAARLPAQTTMTAVAELIQTGLAVAAPRGVVRR